MVPRPRNGLSLCAGGAGLDMGLGLAEPGFHTRAYVEWEQYPRSVLMAAQSAGYLPHAPIWDDLTTFDAGPLAGAIDTLLAGYPCQPFSQAGQRRGADDERHLWPDVARVARELGPGLRWIFLENVSGHVSLGLETVLRTLCDMGFAPAAGLFTAAETGAAHERERVFIVAYRPGFGTGEPHDPQRAVPRPDAWRGAGGGGLRFHEELADTHGGQPGCREQRFQPGSRSAGCESAGGMLDHAQPFRWPEGRNRDHGGDERHKSDAMRGAMELADPSQPRLEGRERRGSSGERHRPVAYGPVAEFRRPLLHAPGPADMDLWRAVLDLAPDLAPSLSLGHVAGVADSAAQMAAQGHLAEKAAQSLVRRMADGLAARSRALRLLGNGVHPLAAGYAWRTLAAAHGLGPVDMDAAKRGGRGGTDEPVWGMT